MAMVSPWITADVIEATEFPQLVRRYDVRGVPKTVVGTRDAFVGSIPEEQFVDRVLKASLPTS